MSQKNPTTAEVNRYSESFVLYGDMTKAFWNAFPTSKCSKKVANVRGSELHQAGKIQVRIKELRKISKTNSDEEFGITVSELKKMLVVCAQKGLKNKKDMMGNDIPVSIPGAVSAISELNKMDGNHAPAKIENIPPRKPVDPSDLEAIRKLAVTDES